MTATTTQAKEKVKEAKSTKTKQYFYAVGRRKTATCTIRLIPGGEGAVTVNQRDLRDYVGNKYLLDTVLFPLRVLGKAKAYDMTIKVLGGGVNAQAEAMRLAISKALVLMDPALRPTLKAEGLLRRDARKVERKKFGRKKARKSGQWSKR